MRREWEVIEVRWPAPGGLLLNMPPTPPQVEVWPTVQARCLERAADSAGQLRRLHPFPNNGQPTVQSLGPAEDPHRLLAPLQHPPAPASRPSMLLATSRGPAGCSARAYARGPSVGTCWSASQPLPSHRPLRAAPLGTPAKRLACAAQRQDGGGAGGQQAGAPAPPATLQQQQRPEQQQPEQQQPAAAERWAPASLLSGWKGAGSMLLSIGAVAGGGLLGASCVGLGVPSNCATRMLP